MTTPPPADPAPATGFAPLGLGKPILDILEALGYEEPTPIQSAAIPPLLAGRDVLGQAATGTGKTAAFALPLLQRLLGEGQRNRRSTVALILVPTRELAMQVAEAVHRYGRGFGASVTPIYGGQSIGQQLRTLSRGVDVVVATPGRALDHIRRGTLVLSGVRALVLDEADEMLDMGFAEDLEAILEAVPAERQTALFSATMPSRIAALAGRHLHDAVRLAIPGERLAKGSVPRVRQVAYMVSRATKLPALSRILDHEEPASALVFCRTRTEVDELVETLTARGHRAEAIHGGLTQVQRDRVMHRFREGTSELLLATDVAARGLDIGRISHVINFDVPSAPEAYVHRIGRTGRAGREGVAITLVEPREQRLLKSIEQLTRQRIEIARVPSVADVRARRMEALKTSLRESLAAGGLEMFHGVVESLGDEHELLDIAAAAIKLLHAAGEPAREEGEIAAPAPLRTEPRRETARTPSSERPAPARTATAAASRPNSRSWSSPIPAATRSVPASLTRSAPSPDASPAVAPAVTARLDAGPFAARRPPSPAAPRNTAARPSTTSDAAPTSRPTAPGMVRLYISGGSVAGVRAADLVGAITGESGLPKKVLGPIEISERFALVDVLAEHAEAVIEAMRKGSVRGKTVTVSRYRVKGERKE